MFNKLQLSLMIGIHHQKVAGFASKREIFSFSNIIYVK